MKLIEKNINQTINEIFIVETISLNNKRILELGCGNANMTKLIANNGFDREVIAYEVDEIQHKKNLELNIKNITFKLCGAEDIQEKDESIDVIFMFKSFHHIPKNLMSKALNEIKRVLKKNGLVYISEPLFMGDQNDLIKIFHDEEEVRIDAFEAIKKAIENEEFKLFKEFFFQSEVTYENFEDFENKMMNTTFNDFVITDEIKNMVKEKYYSFTNDKVTFLKPFRVDILQKI